MMLLLLAACFDCDGMFESVALCVNNRSNRCALGRKEGHQSRRIPSLWMLLLLLSFPNQLQSI